MINQASVPDSRSLPAVPSHRRSRCVNTAYFRRRQERRHPERRLVIRTPGGFRV